MYRMRVFLFICILIYSFAAPHKLQDTNLLENVLYILAPVKVNFERVLSSKSEQSRIFSVAMNIVANLIEESDLTVSYGPLKSKLVSSLYREVHNHP